MKYSLGIDLGTSYFKFGIYDQQTNLKGLGRVAVEKDTDNKGLCELPIARFCKLLKTGIAQACKQAQIKSSEILSIGYSSQANSFLLFDDKFNPLTPLILWPDSRYPEIHTKIKLLWGQPDFLQTTGMGIEPNINLCINKLLWIKQNQPQFWAKVKRVMTISDYLSFLFTGQTVGDFGTASLLGLIDCSHAKWWDTAFEILQLDSSMFSRRLNVGTKFDNLSSEFSKNIGLEKYDFYLGSLDHHMAAIGAGVRDSTDMSISIGTVLACVNITAVYKPQQGICISPWKDGEYCQLTFDGNGAISLEWYQKNFAKMYSIEELIRMAENVSSSDNLEAKPYAFKYQHKEEVFTGIEKHHEHGHFIYALMESSADTLTELSDKISPDKNYKRIFATGGGAKSKLWLEMISKISGVNVYNSKQTESATAGAVHNAK